MEAKLSAVNKAQMGSWGHPVSQDRAAIEWNCEGLQISLNFLRHLHQVKKKEEKCKEFFSARDPNGNKVKGIHKYAL